MRRDFARLIAEGALPGASRDAQARDTRTQNTRNPGNGTAPRLSSQQTAALAALAVRHGEADLASLRGPARELFVTLTIDQLQKLADAGRSDDGRRIGTSGGVTPRAH